MRLLRLLRNIFFPQPGPAPSPSPSPSPTPAPTPTPSGITGDGLIAAINQQRAAHSLGPLKSDPLLNDSAMNWAGYMARNRNMTHGDFADRITHVYPNVSAGEDIAEGQPSIDSVVNTWMHSPPHRANILGQFNIIGAGFATSTDNMIYWCLDFAFKAGE